MLAAAHPTNRLLVLLLDVTQRQQIADTFAAAVARFRCIDVVVNNAGAGACGEAEGLREEDAYLMMEANYWGTARLSTEAIRVFREVNPQGVGGAAHTDIERSDCWGHSGGDALRCEQSR